ncbi:restriction endonuclease subunit S [Hyphomonas atlantica corrig.]|uniref:restriction endonuclease subunit S n=1 Tax=Hyphomonas atlantica TaxID=1280948 RepID=UPI00235286DE|nr:restriction endonuclease subunit S [Hyphomonas atlantica]
MSWHEATIGEFVEIKHGFAFKGEFFDNDGDYVVLTPGNCHNGGGFKSKGEKEKRYSGEIPPGYLLSKGDLLVVMTDLVGTAPVLGGSFLIPEDNFYLHNQRLGLVTLKEGAEADLGFLYHLFNTHDYRGQVRGSASGATVRHTSPSRILACKVKVPELAVQKRIASILSAYDDLIENNRRRIALLEEAARLLYREWFVHFRFPGHEHVKIVDGVPTGWAKQPISKIWDISYGKNLPTAKISISGKYPVHGADKIIGFYSEKNVDESLCLVTCRGAGCGNVRRTFGPTFVTNNCFVFRPRMQPESIRFHFAIHTAQELRMQEMRTGAAQPQLTIAGIGHVEALVPKRELLHSYNEIVDPIFDQADLLRRQVNALSTARDLLLPRLMDGRVEVAA